MRPSGAGKNVWMPASSTYPDYGEQQHTTSPSTLNLEPRIVICSDPLECKLCSGMSGTISLDSSFAAEPPCLSSSTQGPPLSCGWIETLVLAQTALNCMGTRQDRASPCLPSLGRQLPLRSSWPWRPCSEIMMPTHAYAPVPTHCSAHSASAPSLCLQQPLTSWCVQL